MKACARMSMWWPNISSLIQQKWRTCRMCVDRLPSNKKEPVKPREISKFPLQIVHMDIPTLDANG